MLLRIYLYIKPTVEHLKQHMPDVMSKVPNVIKKNIYGVLDEAVQIICQGKMIHKVYGPLGL